MLHPKRSAGKACSRSDKTCGRSARPQGASSSSHAGHVAHEEVPRSRGRLRLPSVRYCGAVEDTTLPRTLRQAIRPSWRGIRQLPRARGLLRLLSVRPCGAVCKCHVRADAYVGYPSVVAGQSKMPRCRGRLGLLSVRRCGAVRIINRMPVAASVAHPRNTTSWW